MSDREGSPPTPDEAADARMAELLREGSTSAEMRERLRRDGGPEAEDLLGRINALDFVHSVVGESDDMPDRLGDYRILGVLGRGGMGIVYRAFQVPLDREVALKVLSPSWSADPRMRERFRAEARATAALHHRHIVPIYDYGETQGRLYFAMERVDGFSLDKHIAAARRVGKRPMEPRDAARRFAGVADALGLAHRRRILHRDVKPGNILVGADGTLALTDFGLAKALDQASMHLTSKNVGFLGTLHYSPPEQALGGDVSPASDLYSLGVTLFEAVTGELPITGRTTEAVLQSILSGTPRRLREVLPRPPRDLEAVIGKLLSRDPAERYQDGEELARDLQRIADGEPVHIRRLPLVVRLWRRARKNPVLSGAVIAAAVLLLVTAFLLRVLRRERGLSLDARHQNELVAIANQVRTEHGPPWGQPPLLDCLCGGPEPPAVAPSGTILLALAKAESELPGDAQVAAMRAAYVAEPDAAASELLRQGRGYEALEQLDRDIVDAQSVRNLVDLSVELRLYQLYLARACANLTASVARIDAARMDLALASFLRPGAVFPRALADALDVVESPDVPVALQRLEQGLASAAVERRAVIGRLLWAAAGLRRDPGANLMAFPLSHRERVELQARAERWSDHVPAAPAMLGEPTGFAARLRQLAQEALQHVGEPGVLRELYDRMGRIARDGVHPESPLQAWWAALQMLEQPRATTPLVDSLAAPLSPPLQLAAWDALLQLSPGRVLVELLLPRFEALRNAHPGLPGSTRVTALLHAAARSPTARSHAIAWVIEQPEESEALFCRLAADLREGQLQAALDDAMAAVQHADDRAAALRSVCSLCDGAAAEAPALFREPILALGASFRALPP